MLNVAAIEASMRKLGLNGSQLAEACGVSKEAASNWRSGESVPRPTKLAMLAQVLQLNVEDLLQVQKITEPRFAYRTRLNLPVSGAALEAAEDLARHLQQLLPFVETRSEFESPVMREPSLDDERIRNAANAVRTSLRLSPSDVLPTEALHELFTMFGAFMVPVLWGLNKQKHENALTVYLPDSKTSWVVFNLGCKVDDYKYWLAHEYGHCLTLHGLADEDGEKFAEAFAQYLVFPQEPTLECLTEMRSSGDPMAIAQNYAVRYEVSIVTVIRSVDRLSKLLYDVNTGLETAKFWAHWNEGRAETLSMSQALFGSDKPSPETYVPKCEEVFKTSIFKALERFQRAEGGRNPAFISNALKISLGDAVALSHFLWTR
jgi:transcriptional regulator with XRE-family HTH domain